MDEVEECIKCVLQSTYPACCMHRILDSQASTHAKNECRGDENASLDVLVHEKRHDQE
ncbi:hypothetical protein D8674_005196 [Pyrus ussuriensis x Pyrus communis]|uniref:Uncharacterized protein n=1 Tax=Pyrus ussuriensis x Pyrus communis TaxID=2448454 RepID=A0A5N5FQS1_9ROSA|nr:hypothetical protein D8674_005196 [Pyrus ussuriensis x Pyrus communis]